MRGAPARSAAPGWEGWPTFLLMVWGQPAWMEGQGVESPPASSHQARGSENGGSSQGERMAPKGRCQDGRETAGTANSAAFRLKKQNPWCFSIQQLAGFFHAPIPRLCAVCVIDDTSFLVPFWFYPAGEAFFSLHLVFAVAASVSP